MGRRPALFGAVHRVGQLGGVPPQQIVEGEPADPVLGDQVGLGQFGQLGPHRGRGQPGQAGRRGGAAVRPGVQAEQPEQPGRGRAQLPVRPGEQRRDIGAGVPGGQHLQGGAALPQLAGERGQPERRLGAGPGGDHGQRQRQPGTPVDDVVDRTRLGGHPGAAEALPQQPTRLVHGEQVEVERVRALGRDQAGRQVAAGDHDQAGGRPGQQRPDLGPVDRVVQHHQHPLAGGEAAVHGDLGVLALRDPTGRHPERVQEPAHRLGRRHRCRDRVEPAQVHVELPVRELVGHPVGPVHGERRLTHAGRTGDGGDRHRRGGARGGQQRVQLGDRALAAGERREVRRQLPGRSVHNGHLYGRPGAGRVEGGILAQDGRLQVPDRRSRVDAEVVDEAAAQPVERGERVGRAPGPVERQHQLAVQPLPVRMLLGQVPQLGHQGVVLTELHPSLDDRLGGVVLQRDQPVGLRVEPGQPGQVGQRTAAPQVQRLLQPSQALHRIALPGCRLDQAGRLQDVGVLTLQLVPGAPVHQRPRAEHPAQVGDVALQRVQRGRRRPAVPHDVDEPVVVDELTGREPEHREHGLRAQPRDPT